MTTIVELSIKHLFLRPRHHVKLGIYQEGGFNHTTLCLLHLNIPKMRESHPGFDFLSTRIFMTTKIINI